MMEKRAGKIRQETKAQKEFVDSHGIVVAGPIGNKVWLPVAVLRVGYRLIRRVFGV